MVSGKKNHLISFTVHGKKNFGKITVFSAKTGFSYKNFKYTVIIETIFSN